MEPPGSPLGELAEGVEEEEPGDEFFYAEMAAHA